MSSIIPDVSINTSTSMVNFIAEEQQKLAETLIQGILEGIPDSEYIREVKQAAIAENIQNENIQKSQQFSSEIMSLSSTSYDFFTSKSNTDGHLVGSKSTYATDSKSSLKQESDELRAKMQNLEIARGQRDEMASGQGKDRV
ncbi:hypothetical protein [uncultured Shewanella sp.]|uniref:hypothetical protein n=1 Tax=uncultured Shewanella sp. TaxID=173975 RepID=UPI00261D58AE|nr:hypothetical protein [uncultured Shewanella sp.]